MNKPLLKLFILLSLCLTAVATLFGCSDADKPLRQFDDFSYCLSYVSSFDSQKPVFVIGHLAPDTDSVCSAVAYSELLKKLGFNAVAVTAGKPNAETVFMFDKFDIALPDLLENADGLQLILVDHNSYLQAVSGADKADIVAVIDHHAIGDIQTAFPILFINRPLGSTASVVYAEYLETNTEVSVDTAKLMLVAILSDTENLTSPITTEFDRTAVTALAEIAGIDDVAALAKELEENDFDYSSMTAKEILFSDYKEYNVNGTAFSVSMATSTSDTTLESVKNTVTPFIEENFDSLETDMCFFMLTNTETRVTRLLCFGENALETAQKAFGISDDDVVLENAISRKADVIPFISNALK